jgi:hypothetical protein
MFRGRQIRVEGTVVETETGPFHDKSAAPKTNIVLDVHTPEGKLVRVTFKQKLWGQELQPPEAGDVVPVDWDPKQGTARLALKGDARYDLGAEKRQQKDAFKAAANAPAGTPSQPHEAENEDVEEARKIQQRLQKSKQFEDEAKRLNERRKSGAITEAEFEQEKRRLLDERLT